MPNDLTFMRAAELLELTRPDILAGTPGAHLARVSEKGKNIDAALTTGNVMLITGSSNLQDYLFYNLRPLRPLPSMTEIDRICQDLPRRAYHKGFLLHAARILRFLGSARPDYIVGHSLGAASAQILGTALNVPTICFASPQVVKRRFLKAARFRQADHPQWKVFNVAWEQDFVTRGYRMTGLRALGHRVELDLESQNIGIDHFVRDYKRLITADAAGAAPKLPKHWPDPSYPLPPQLA